MKQVSAFALGLVVLVSCGRASNLEPSDDLGSGGADSSKQTGGSTASGGNSSGGATGSSAAGGEAALGGMGGEDGLPLCEPWGYPVPTVTQRLLLNGYNWEGADVDGEHSYEGQVVTGPVDEIEAIFEGTELNAWFSIQINSPAPHGTELSLLRQLFTDGEELHMKFYVTNYTPLFAELRRMDGSLVAFVYTGIFQSKLIASLGLPIPWALETACRHEVPGYDFIDGLNLRTQLGTTEIELSSYEEQQIEADGRPFMLTVHRAVNVGRCSGESCGQHPQLSGNNLDAQLIALD